MPQAIATLINARWIVPVEPSGLILEHHALAIQDGRIVAILPQDEAAVCFTPATCLNLDSHVLIPGLINAHTHASMVLLRGLADDLPLMNWLQNHIWPTEARWVNPDFVRDGARLAIAEMLRGGATCFNDMYFFPEVTAAMARECGIRACVGLIALDFPTAYARNLDEYLSKGLALHETLSAEPLLHAAFAPHAPYTVSASALERIGRLAEALELPIHIHVHETAAEVAQFQIQHGCRPLERLDQLGLLSPRLLAVHMTQLEAAEIDRLAERGVHVIHCPESNLKLASGFCPTARLDAAGVNVAIGTDGAASNNDLDLFGELRTAALLGTGVLQGFKRARLHIQFKYVGTSSINLAQQQPFALDVNHRNIPAVGQVQLQRFCLGAVQLNTAGYCVIDAGPLEPLMGLCLLYTSDAADE